MKFEPRGYRWRMNDPWCRIEAAKRPPFVRLAQLVITQAVRAKHRGYAIHGPNKHGRHFHPLSTDVLDARRIGISPRVLAGRGGQSTRRT